MIWGRRPPNDAPVAPVEQLPAAVTDDGLTFRHGGADTAAASAATALLDQLADEGLAERDSHSHRIGWTQLYLLLEDTDAKREMAILPLPDIIAATPRLVSRGSLTEENFAVAIDGWFDGDRRRLADARLDHGALHSDGRPHLLSPSVWHLVERVRRFARREADARGEAAQRRALG